MSALAWSVAQAQPRRPSESAGPTGVGRETGGPTRPLAVEPEDRRCRSSVRARDPLDLRAKLADSTFRGCIVIPRDVSWVMEDPCGERSEFGNCVVAGLMFLEIRPGVSLIGERGALGSRPRLVAKRVVPKYCLFTTAGNDVRIEGIHFEGPGNAKPLGQEPPYNTAVCVTRDPTQKAGATLILDNEFAKWPGSGVVVQGRFEGATEADYVTAYREQTKTESGPVPFHERADASLVRIERNYFHHNLRNAGGGYGVNVGSGSFAEITGNVFEFNRHDVASDGFAHSGYIARFNFVLAGGVKEGSFYNQHFDVHGIGAGGYGKSAGVYYEISHNTFRGAQSYGLKKRSALMLRGTPEDGAHFNENFAVHCDLDAAVSLKSDKNDSGWGEDHAQFDFHATGNRFNVDFSSELAAGDFDGDGRSDVFVATGKAWFYSRAGKRPWEFLRASDLRIHELAFADIDNDKVTDVVFRDGAGNLSMMKSGVSQPSKFTVVPVPIRELRFGDFDGDKRTDVFYKQARQWYVWYGATRTWRTTQSSDIPLSQYLFGEFDDVPGTDVVAPANGNWSYSSGATGSWQRLNDMLRSSLDGAVAADFDGSGKTDIAFGSGQVWIFSRDGRGPLKTLRSGSRDIYYPELRSLPIGPFDGGLRAKAMSFEYRQQQPACQLNPPRTPIAGERLMLWGYGSDGTFEPRSSQNMR